MRRLSRSLSGKDSAATHAVKIPLTSGNKDTPDEPSSTSEQDQSFFTSIIDKFYFKNLNFGLTTTSSPTSDQSSTSSETSHGEPIGTGTQISDPVEPTYLASKIQSLLKILPSHSPGTLESTKDSNQSQRDNGGRPISPHGVTQVHDARLIAMLQSATVMNGGQHRDDIRERRRSVWSVLDSLEGEDRSDAFGGCENGRSREDDLREASGVMMYSPLTPTNLSLVEIAESGVFDPEKQEEKVDPTSETAQAAGWMGMWPFTIWSNSAAAGFGNHPTAGIAPSIATEIPSPNNRNVRLNAQGKRRVWIPSGNKLSFQTVWWGYRIYLPPPVMDTLGDKSMEYAKRAATITTALTWFFYNIPLTVLPTTVRPAVLLLQTLIPYVGYLGGFISWSWGTIQSYDTGHGVILTATWLLPVALIPSTWEVDDFPPPSPPSPSDRFMPSPCPYPSSPTVRPSPTALLPTPPITPPSTIPLSPEVPTIQVSTEQLLSSAQSFTTALASPLQFAAPAPSPLSHLPLAATASSPACFLDNTDVRILSPMQSVSPYLYSPSPAFLHAFEPLPPWVTPPPPPRPLIIPLPEIEEETETPRFAMRVLGKVRGGRSKKGRKDERQDEREQTSSKVNCAGLWKE